MADLTMGNADETPVFINNSSETNEVTCACCDKFKIEPQKTITELRAALEIIELLREVINTPNRTVSTDTRYWHQNKNCTQLEPQKRELGSCALIASEKRQ